jgi:hypothetical protein
MNPEIYYRVTGTLYRSKGDETNPIEIDKTFEDENPIVAREKAFSYYQSYIDVLLQSNGKEYVSHEKTVLELLDFFKSGRKHKLLPDLVDMDGTSLCIYLIKKIPEAFENALGDTYYQNKWQIHNIDSQSEDFSAYIFKSLMYEYSIYAKQKYNCKTYKASCDTSNYFTNSNDFENSIIWA